MVTGRSSSRSAASTLSLSYSACSTRSRSGASSVNGTGSGGPGSLRQIRPKARYTSALERTTAWRALPAKAPTRSASLARTASMSITTCGSNSRNVRRWRSNSAKSPCTCRAGRSGSCSPRWNSITAWPAAASSRTRNGPTNRVPPSTRIRTTR